MIKLNSVCKTYKTKYEGVCALENISLDIIDNELTFIAGSSGSGKSTLLNAIAGIDSIDSGSIEINGIRDNIRGNRINPNVGIVLQEPHLIEFLSVYDNLRLAIDKDDSAAISDALASVELSGYEKKLAKDLSGGEKERVAIARALVKNANILLCDEPTGALDRENAEKIFSLLKSLSTKLTVIVVSHDKDSALKFADRIVELEYGRIISDKRYNEVRNKEVSYAKAITPRISLGLISKLSFKYMLKRVLMPVLSLVMLIMLVFSLGLSISLQVRNETEIIAEAMDNIGIKVIGLKKEIRYTDSDGDTGNRFYCMSQNEVGELEESLNEKLYSVHSFKKGGSINNNVSSGLLFKNELNGYLEINDDIMSELSLELLAGALPNKYNELAISEYVLGNVIKDFEKSSEGILAASNDAIGSTIIIDKEEFIITGVINTGFNYDRYGVLADNGIDYNSIPNYLEQELDNNLAHGLYNVVFAPKGFSKKHIYNMEDNIISLNASLNTSNGKYLDERSRIIINDKNFEYNIYFNDGRTNGKLKANEILMPVKTIGSADFILQNRIDDYAARHFDEVKDSLSEDLGRAACVNDYLSYLISYENDYSDPKYLKVTKEDIYNDCIVNELRNDEAIKSPLKLKLSLELSDAYSVEADVEIAGFYYDYDLDKDNSNIIKGYYCTDELLASLDTKIQESYLDISHAVTPFIGANERSISILNKLEKEYTSSDTANIDGNLLKIMSYSYKNYNECVSSYEYAIASISTLKKAAFYTSIAMLIAFIAFMAIYFNQTIGSNINDLGAYRMLGHSRLTIAGIIGIAPMIVFIIAAVLANFIGYGLIDILNSYQIKKSALLFSIFSYKRISFVISIAIVSVILLINITIEVVIRLRARTSYMLNKIEN